MDKDLSLSVKDGENSSHDISIGDGNRQVLVSIDSKNNRLILYGSRGEKQIVINSTDGKNLWKKFSELLQKGFSSVESNKRSNYTETHRLVRDSMMFINLPKGAIIEKIDLIINEPFQSPDGAQHNISIIGETGETLMPEPWNDPNEAGCYTTSLNYTAGSQGFIMVKHDLQSTVSGSGSIKLYESVHESVEEMKEEKWTVG